MIRPLANGIFRDVSAPVYGDQDIGRSPGGPQDRFAWRCARLMLGESSDLRSWELILPPAMEVTEDAVAVITGGSFREVRVNGKMIPHAQVFRVRAGERIQWGVRKTGFRTVLALRPYSSDAERLMGRARGAFGEIARWQDPDGAVRVLPGPEVDRVPNAEDFLNSPWSSTMASSDEGIRLTGGPVLPADKEWGKMVSAPVADGTVQVTPEGLIVLLRSRPTMGGYPRGWNVLEVDVDLMAQLPPRRRVRFRLVGPEEAVAARKLYEEDLIRLRERLQTKGE